MLEFALFEADCQRDLTAIAISSSSAIFDVVCLTRLAEVVATQCDSA
jgi:hypothetical protein